MTHRFGSVQKNRCCLLLDDSEEVLRSRIDVVGAGATRTSFWGVCRLWNLKKTSLFRLAALPSLAYMMANLSTGKNGGYGLVTNGDDILFVKLKRDGSALYDVSRVFALFTSGRELYGVLQVLKRIAGEIVGVGG